MDSSLITFTNSDMKEHIRRLIFIQMMYITSTKEVVFYNVDAI